MKVRVISDDAEIEFGRVVDVWVAHAARFGASFWVLSCDDGEALRILGLEEVEITDSSLTDLIFKIDQEDPERAFLMHRVFEKKPKLYLAMVELNSEAYQEFHRLRLRSV